jgi:anti-sigma factor RsiW
MHEWLECDQAMGKATAYLEGALPPEVRQDFEMHLEKCQRCQRHLKEIRWTIDHLGALPRESMPAAMKERLLEAQRSRKSA